MMSGGNLWRLYPFRRFNLAIPAIDFDDGVLTYFDLREITANDGSRPHACKLTKLYIPHNQCGCAYK
jgi:hypothetical protein